MNHPITPSPELVDQWFDDARNAWAEPQHYVADRAAQWGADQELEACCEWIPEYCPWDADQLRAARRPKPPSLKERSLQLLKTYNTSGVMLTADQADTIRHALEALDD
jgi:hypothetical protein